MTTWYLWAVNDDPATNEYLVQIIGEGNEECLYRGKACVDGRKRNLFRCLEGYANVQSAIAAVPQFGLKIEVFKTEGDERPVRFDLWKKSVRKKAKHKRSALMLRPHKAPRRVPF